MTLDIRDWVWLAFLAREVVERSLAKPMSQIYLNLQAFDMHLNFLVLTLQFNSDIKLFKLSGFSFTV